MARPIKETPTLSGKDAEQFLEYISTPHPAPKEEIEQARKIYEAVMSDPRSNWMR